MSNEEKFWYEENGAKKLNEIAVNLIGDHIGYVPLQNLLPEIETYDLDELFAVINSDGAKTRFDEYQNGFKEILVYLD